MITTTSPGPNQNTMDCDSCGFMRTAVLSVTTAIGTEGVGVSVLVAVSVRVGVSVGRRVTVDVAVGRTIIRVGVSSGIRVLVGMRVASSSPAFPPLPHAKAGTIPKRIKKTKVNFRFTFHLLEIYITFYTRFLTV